jgi:CHAD domain-containing protein/HD superfamily phosphodiesterase
MKVYVCAPTELTRSVKYLREIICPEETLKKQYKPTGLRYWMLRVLEECGNAAADFQPDPVHDLRVSLRRCRSLADGMIAMDPDREWKSMKKAGKKLFQSLGALRDVQIMMEWIEKLNDVHVARTPSFALPSKQDSANATAAHQLDPAARALIQVLKTRETEHKRQARTALDEFDRKQWQTWSRTLPQRAARIRPGSAVFKHLALERWTAARELHTRAMRTRSQVALHTLRIGIKRFRYIVENFLPKEHKLWGNDLKHMQDLLGEVHDLDVLWETARQPQVFPDESSRTAWQQRIQEERAKRLEEYRQRATGKESLWNLWRDGLPKGKQIQQIATARLRLWAKALDPDFAHSQRVAKLALQLHDALDANGLLGKSRITESDGAATDSRASLYLAALLHDVGKAEGNNGHHKRSLELIKAHGAPLGWKPEVMQRAAVIARFHCGALPTRSHKLMRDLLSDEQRALIRLSAILRLANALDAAHDGQVRRIRLERADAKRRSNGFLRKPPALGKNEALLMLADGYVDGSPTARTVAAERYLLETLLRRPVIVRASPISRVAHAPTRTNP